MLGAFILSMPERPDTERLTVYYANSMMTKPMKWFCRKSGKNKFTERDIAGMKATAADRNPYSWNMEYHEYPDSSGYEGRFTKCGICVLMKKLGLYDLTPALCRLDYTMDRTATADIRRKTDRRAPNGARNDKEADCHSRLHGFAMTGKRIAARLTAFAAADLLTY